MARNTGLTEKARHDFLEFLDDEKEHSGNLFFTSDKIEHAIVC